MSPVARDPQRRRRLRPDRRRRRLRLPPLRAAARGEPLMAQGWLQIAIFVAVLVALIKPVGIYMARVFTGQRVFLSPVVGPIERLTYRVLRVRPDDEGQDWKAYARSLIVFSLFSWIALYLILRTQGIQPFNPEGFHSGPWDVSFNTDLLLRHQHQLAVLRRRNDAHLLRPDGRPDGAELRLRRGRDRRRRRPDPRHRRPLRRGSSATSGRTWSAPCSTSCCRSRSSAPSSSSPRA